MNQSENIIELIKALTLAQSEMEPALKDSANPFFKSKYADLNSVMSVCRPVLTKNGLCVIQTTEIQNEKTILVSTLAHTSGQWIRSYIALNPVKNDPQGMGAAMTYLRRYSLMALVGVVTDDDDGETACGRGENVTKPNKIESKPALPKEEVKKPNKEINFDVKVTNEQVEILGDLYSKCDTAFRKSFGEYMRTKWRAHVMNDIPLDCFETAFKGMELNIEKNKEKAQICA